MLGKKMDEKLISVIVAAYNIEEYLPRCLESILSQTYTNLEILLVDDGSEDDTGIICDKYAAQDSRIIVIHQENKGLSGARNAALSVAQGAYIGYVDGDDFIEPDMYKEMYRACEQQNAEIAICAYREVGANVCGGTFSGEYYVLSREEALAVYINDDREYHIYNSVWSKLFKRELVDGIFFPEGKKSEDIMYTTQALVNCNTCVFLDQPYYNYVIDRTGSIMNQRLDQRRFQDEIPFWREHILCIRNAGMSELSSRAAYQFYRRMLFYYVDFADRGMKESCRKMEQMLLQEKECIYEIYENDFVTLGDKVRMKLFLRNPSGYHRIVKLYDKTIMRLRQ